MSTVKEAQLRYLEYLHRENFIRHHRYDEEMFQYHLVKAGDNRAVDEGKKMWSSGLTGKVNDDDLKNQKYLFVASITLACRFAIEGGLEEERAYNISDLYIQQMDACKTTEEITDLHTDMMSFYAKEVAAAKKKYVYSKPVLNAMDYIYYHLHERQTAEQIASAVDLSPNYLSSLFKKELGMTIYEYMNVKRIEAAENMLRYSDFSYNEIASILAFSSQSHFIRIFRKTVGCTPKEYRDRVGAGGSEFDETSGKKE